LLGVVAPLQITETSCHWE